VRTITGWLARVRRSMLARTAFLLGQPDQLVQFHPDLLVGAAIGVEPQHLLVLVEGVAAHHDGQHGNGPVAQDVAHLVRQPGLDAVLLDDGFQVGVGGRQLVQAHQGERDDERQRQAETGADGGHEFSRQLGDAGGHGGSGGRVRPC
jgi:hypothetical protein